jgi:hypothetical protein
MLRSVAMKLAPAGVRADPLATRPPTLLLPALLLPVNILEPPLTEVLS